MRDRLVTFALSLVAVAAQEVVGGPLHAAALSDSVQQANAAIASGAGLHERDALGYTPLHRCAEDDAKGVASILLRRRADVEARDHDKATPVMVAAGSGSMGVLEQLLDHGASVKAFDDFGATALHYAAEHNHVAAVRLLLDRGADPDAKTHQGRTPGYIAMLLGHYEIGKMIRRAGSGVVEGGEEDKVQYTPPENVQLPAGAQPLFSGAAGRGRGRGRADVGGGSGGGGAGEKKSGRKKSGAWHGVPMPTNLQPEKLEL